MEPGSSNVDDVADYIKRIVATFDWTRPGVEQSMGEDCVHAIAEDIASSAAELQESPGGEPFPENEPRYAARKAKLYGMHPPAYGFRTGQTFSLQSLLGEIVVQADQVEMRYGTGNPPVRSSGSAYISEADKRVSDIEKMFFLTRTARRPISPYKIGPYATEEVRRIIVEGLRRHLMNGG